MRGISSLTIVALLAGCGGVGFEVGDADREEQKKAEHRIVTLPTEPLKVTEASDEPVANGVGANDAAGVIGSFSYQADDTHELHLDILHKMKDECPDEDSTKLEFLWRELAANGETAAETELDVHDFFDAKAGTAYMLIVEMETRVGRCKHLSVAFGAKRYLR